jgi:hypothetical protein
VADLLRTIETQLVMTDVFGFKVVTRDYRSLHVSAATERWTVGSRHRFPSSDGIDPGVAGYQFCRTLHDLRRQLPVAGRFVRLVRVRVPAGATVVERKGSYALASELVVVEELSSLWHLTTTDVGSLGMVAGRIVTTDMAAAAGIMLAMAGVVLYGWWHR